MSFPSLFPSALVAAALILTALVVASAPAGAVRPIPDEASKAVLEFGAAGVRLGGEAVVLSAGAQIRDAHNRIVPSSHLRGPYRVRALRDGSGQLHRVWILTDEEAAAPMPRVAGGPPGEPSQ